MKKANDDIDRLAKDLISKGLLKPKTFDFDDRLMAKIMLAPSPERLKSNENYKESMVFVDDSGGILIDFCTDRRYFFKRIF